MFVMDTNGYKRLYIYVYIYIQGLQGMECHTVIYKNRMRFITKLVISKLRIKIQWRILSKKKKKKKTRGDELGRERIGFEQWMSMIVWEWFW